MNQLKSKKKENTQKHGFHDKLYDKFEKRNKKYKDKLLNYGLKDEKQDQQTIDNTEKIARLMSIDMPKERSKSSNTDIFGIGRNRKHSDFDL